MKNFSLLKKLLLCSIISLSCTSLSYGQIGLGLSYINTQPMNGMGRYIDMAHGLAFEGSYRIPKSRLSVGMSTSLNLYGHDSRDEVYRFSNGIERNVDVEVCNQFANVTAFLQFDLLDKGPVLPYVQLGTGLSVFWTDLQILDPEEEYTSDCPKPIESKVLLADVTPQYTLASGFKIDLGSIFGSNTLDQNRFYFDLRASYTKGGNVRYMNSDIPTQNTTPTNIRQDGEVVSVKFASESEPDVVHEYYAGKSYKSALESFSIQGGIHFRLD